MTPRIRSEDLIDANVVAAILGLSHRNSVAGYLKRYPDMPRPIVDIPSSKIRLWLRPEIERWAAKRGGNR